MLAGPDCPSATEWFGPGTAPASVCDWHRRGGVALPAEYAEWADERRELIATVAATPGFRLVSPVDGDVYRVPPGAEARYATLALRAAGGAGRPRFFVDGRPYPAARWELRSGTHRVRAVSAGGEVAEATIRVE
jgi:membrane carboxypeptidase/penicillin-binding protein PbpC